MTVLAETIADTVGPVVVKEVRQGLRARVCSFFSPLLLVGCLGFSLFAFASIHDGVRLDGREFLSVCLVALGVITHFVVPFVGFRSMLREREDETWVLLTLTGLSTVSIVRGKWLSAMSQSMLYASVCAPFVLFSYFLNRVDLLQLLAGLALSFTTSALCTALGLALATQAHSKLARTVVHFVALGSLGLLAFGSGAMAVVIAQEGDRLVESAGLHNAVLGLVLFGGLLTWLLLEGGAASLVLPSQSQSPRVRLPFAVVAVSAMVFTSVAFLTSGRGAADLVAGQVFLCFFLVVGGLFAVSERDGWARTDARARWLRSGALRSFWLVQGLLAAAAIVAVGFVADATGYLQERAFAAVIAAALYPSLYLSLAVLLGRLTALQRRGEPLATRFAFLLTVAVGICGSTLLSFLTEARANAVAPNVFNPFFGLLNFVDRGSGTEPALAVLGVTTLFVTGLAGSVLYARDGVRA